ncbi:tyrosine-type recombinase/integrase [Chamaesiphon sp. VAR_48_metabat_135_sub]|uniref:tyrosine-type recombinase/integrase n=1 Tax=Chamaesiphon sp. VAR_48_metabat_135_sub TaxID=2964699 RepID=UPI00286D1B88|nr:tyrosine-type recombinase/integrase [Chamaesiphon sp. VAR_48_metabat_135_sub]
MHIEERGTSLIIRWRFEGKKFHKTLSKHNNPIGRKHTEMVMASIEKDIMCGRFDPSIYSQKGKDLKQAIDTLTAVSLFAKYAEYRMLERELSNSSRERFKAIGSKLRQLLGDEFLASRLTTEIAIDTIGRWSQTVSERTARAYLFDLCAAWEWAKKEGSIECEVNPWSKSLDRLRKKLPPPKKPKPFTIDELRAIADAFDRLPESYSFYKDLVIFISQTACRFGEMAALRWSDVDDSFKVVTFRSGVSRGHFRDTTKTGEFRVVLMTPTLTKMLETRHQQSNPSHDDLVFPSPKGRFLRDNNFRNRIYIPILKVAGVEYRKPYTYRHSGVSHAVSEGVPIAEIAAQTGHSAKTLMSSYLHAIEQKIVFTDYLDT